MAPPPLAFRKAPFRALPTRRVTELPVMTSAIQRPQAANKPSRSAAAIRALPLAAIQANARNPRLRLRDVPELASSMQSYGLLQPVVVRPVADGYVLLAGHRRVEAARSLGWDTIPS